MSTDKTSQLSSQSVCLNFSIRTSIHLPWESRSGTLGISPKWPELSLITKLMSSSWKSLEIELPLSLMPVTLKRLLEMDRLLKEFMRPLWTLWDNRLVTSISPAFKISVTRLWKCSISGHLFKNIWKAEWKLLPLTWLVWSARILPQNSFHTLDL